MQWITNLHVISYENESFELKLLIGLSFTFPLKLKTLECGRKLLDDNRRLKQQEDKIKKLSTELLARSCRIDAKKVVTMCRWRVFVLSSSLDLMGLMLEGVCKSNKCSSLLIMHQNIFVHPTKHYLPLSNLNIKAVRWVWSFVTSSSGCEDFKEALSKILYKLYARDANKFSQALTRKRVFREAFPP